MMKTCTKCGETKSLSNFYKHSGKKDGYFNHCSWCEQERREELKENPIKKMESQLVSIARLESKLLKNEGKFRCSCCKEIFLFNERYNNGHCYCIKCYKEKYLKKKLEKENKAT